MKRHHPELWSNAAKFMDLGDFLVFSATGVDQRSVCTTTCKWTYLPHKDGWQSGYFVKVGLEDLVEDDFSRIGGRSVAQMGQRVGYMLPALAEELGLPADIAVAAAAIDAHAGAVGTLGVVDDIQKALACICGTSMCK